MRQYLVLGLMMLVLGSGCGKKGDPRAPELATPKTITNLTARSGPVRRVSPAREDGVYVGDLHQGARIMKTFLKNLITDDQGGEVLEYALIAGLIVVAAIAVITSVGTKVFAKWQSVDQGLGT